MLTSRSSTSPSFLRISSAGRILSFISYYSPFNTASPVLSSVEIAWQFARALSYIIERSHTTKYVIHHSLAIFPTYSHEVLCNAHSASSLEKTSSQQSLAKLSVVPDTQLMHPRYCDFLAPPPWINFRERMKREAHAAYLIFEEFWTLYCPPSYNGCLLTKLSGEPSNASHPLIIHHLPPGYFYLFLAAPSRLSTSFTTIFPIISILSHSQKFAFHTILYSIYATTTPPTVIVDIEQSLASHHFEGLISYLVYLCYMHQNAIASIPHEEHDIYKVFSKTSLFTSQKINCPFMVPLLFLPLLAFPRLTADRSQTDYTAYNSQLRLTSGSVQSKRLSSNRQQL